MLIFVLIMGLLLCICLMIGAAIEQRKLSDCLEEAEHESEVAQDALAGEMIKHQETKAELASTQAKLAQATEDVGYFQREAASKRGEAATFRDGLEKMELMIHALTKDSPPF